MACIEESELARFAEGVLGEAEQHRIWEHLAECTECRRVAAHAASTIHSPVRSRSRATAARPVLTPGSVVARYTVVKLIGAGAMGVVYEALDPLLARHVALKLLRTDAGTENPLAEAALTAEARAAARLSHPNVVSVYDAGASDAGPFIAFELVAGETLREWLGRGRRGARAVLSVMLQAGRGLAAAHASDIVHRDFKPENLLLGADGRVRVSDFGLALLRPAATASSAPDSGAATPDTAPQTPASRAGACDRSVVAGTPGYMAPEVLAGREADARSDQYSFCATLREALRDQLPPRVQRIVQRGLAIDPAERWPSMAELAGALERELGRTRRRLFIGTAIALLVIGCLPGSWQAARWALRDCSTEATQELVTAYDPGRREVLAKAFAATGAPLAQGSFAAVARGLDDYAVSWQRVRVQACAEPPPDEAEAAAILLCLDRRRVELEALVELLAAADAQTVQRATEAVANLQSPSVCVSVATLRSPVRPTRTGEQQAAVAALYPELATVKTLQLLELYSRSRDAAEALLPRVRAVQYPALEVDTLSALGLAQGELGEYDDAIATLKNAALLAERSSDDAGAARAYMRLVHVAGTLQNRAELADWSLEQAEVSLARLPTDHALLSDYLMHVSFKAFERRDFDRALGLAQQGLEHARTAFGAGGLRTAELVSLLGGIQAERGAYEESRALQEQALTIRRHIFGERHPSIARSLNNLGQAHLLAGHFVEALEAHSQALAMREEQLSTTHPATAWSRCMAADVQCRLGNCAEAILRYEQSIQSLIAGHGRDHYRVAGVYGLLATALADVGRYEEARTAAQEAVRIARKLDNPHGGILAESLRIHGQVELSATHPERAVPLLLEAERLHQSLGIDTEIWLTRLALGQARWQSTHEPQALQLAVDSREMLMQRGGLYAIEARARGEWLDEALAKAGRSP